MERFRILIVGAGASGIAAGAKLLESGFTDFRILEAGNRIGGRINTTTVGDIPIELGAEWIHGEKGNIVYELASSCDLADTDLSNTASILNINYYDSAGCLIHKDISWALAKAYYDSMNIDENEISSEFFNGSLGSYFDVKFQEAVEEFKKNLNIDTDLCKKFIKIFENWQNSIDGSHSWYETSLSGHLQYHECDGNLLTQWKNNRYDTILKLLTKKFPNPKEQLPLDNKILLNKEVIKINWNEKCLPGLSNVKVECLDGSVYCADNILVTCSLGVLKERAEKMFVPFLPLKKLNCILQNLGFGTVDKIFVKFRYKWWENDFDGCSFLWSEEERNNDSTGWLNGVICFHPVSKSCPVMRGWITGEAAQNMESLSNDDILRGINFLFKKFLGPSLNVPSIETCVTSKWFINPHFRGSYSCRLMKSERSNVWASQLAEPVYNIRGIPIVFFGGEATHDHFFSTVHGAIEAGQREAIKMLKTVLEESQTSKCVQVAIVGGGISGLAAAKTLLDNGVTDITVLEAQSEFGGRIRSLQFEDYFLELGAQWIHGTKNEVFNICRDHNLLTSECSSEGEGLYYRENGERIDENLIKEIDDVVKDILENCENYILSKEKTYRSIGEELLVKFNEYLESCIQDSDEIKEMKKELFGWHIKYHLIDNSCSDLFDLSAKAWGLFKFCGGHDYVNFRNGYSSLINIMVNCLPDNILHCGTSVKRIDWLEEINLSEHNSTNFMFDDYSAKITTSDGETINCQYVIVTSSLGYLKENYKTMFCPSLPKYLSEAIEFLDFGVMNKIFLIYEKAWWDSKAKGFQLVWSRDDGSELHWGRYLTGFDVILKDKPVLLGWIGGEGAIAVEQISEEEIGRQATAILRRFTKIQNIPLPKKVVRTNWWSNEYIRGAYCHITVKCDESEICCSNLAQPVFSTVHTKGEKIKKPTILLAGESTHKNHFSTVHGAYESGKNQAQVILQHIQSRKKL